MAWAIVIPIGPPVKISIQMKILSQMNYSTEDSLTTIVTITMGSLPTIVTITMDSLPTIATITMDILTTIVTITMDILTMKFPKQTTLDILTMKFSKQTTGIMKRKKQVRIVRMITLSTKSLPA